MWSPWLEVMAGDTVPAWMRLTDLLLLPNAPGRTKEAASGDVEGTSVAIARIIAAI